MSRNDRFIKIGLVIARILFGITFLFSGFVKAVDPLGFTYKIEDYLISFHLTQFIPLALSVAVVLIILEFLLGIFILLGLFRKWSTSLAVLFMLVMTPMTLYIALENPVADCGCFGDALVISNWTTFYKNIVLISLALFLFVYRNNIRPYFSSKTKNIVLGFLLLFSILFCLYNILYLPIMDFRPYRVGVNIPEQMEVDLNNGDVYENIYIYEKDGIEEEFTEDTFPWEDSTWTFVDFKAKLIKEAEQPVIEEFHIVAYNKDSAGMFVKADDITQQVLSEPISLLVVSLSLDDANESAMKQITTMADYAVANNIDMQIVTSSEAGAIKQWSEKLGNANLNFAGMDELTLKTIIRSNPGLLLLKKGTIEAKWSSRNLPKAQELDRLLVKIQLKKNGVPHNNSSGRLFILCILFVLPLSGIKWYDRRDARKQTRK